MTDVDRMTDLSPDEQRLRTELARTLVPPPTPASLRVTVDALAAEHLAAPKRADRRWREALAIGARGFRFAAGAVAVVAVLAVAGLVLLQTRGEGDVAATPVPTLPAVTQPALPDPSGTGRITTGAGWIDADTAWATTGDSTDLWMTTDGGQTWEERGSVPNSAVPVFVDRSSAYAAYAVPSTASGHAFGVYRTVDGGRTWLPFQAGVVPATEGSSPTVEAHFTDPDHGVVLGTSNAPQTDDRSAPVALECRGWSTDNGGSTWAPMPSPPCIWLGIQWASPRVGLLLDGTSGRALTTDGGRTWDTRTTTTAAGELWGVHAVTAADGSARLVASTERDDRLSDLAVYQREPDGQSWSATYPTLGLEVTANVAAVADLGGGHWLAIGNGNAIPGNVALWDSWDEGRTWVRSADTLLVIDNLTAWADRLHGVMQGGWMDCRDRTKDCSASPSTMWLTNDGGRTWHEVPF